MTIQRKYSLPNCTLILEGLSSNTAPEVQTNVRPVLSILVNVECYLASVQQPLTGGRDFFESLVTAVSDYAQEFLSKVHHPEAHKSLPGLIQVQKIDSDRHRLIVSSDQERQDHNSNGAVQIDLTTVQLFDLVEAVDQVLADSQTLPDLSLQLKPLSKRYVSSRQSLVTQAVPASVGASSLALAAIAFFLAPTPEVEPPSAPKPQSSSSQSTDVAAAPEITNPVQRNALQQKLYNQLNQSWKRSALQQDLGFRVVVAENGALIGYKSIDAAANEAIAQTPLPDLLYNPVGDRATQKPTAQFRVVFAKNGELKISPWQPNN